MSVRYTRANSNRYAWTTSTPITGLEPKTYVTWVYVVDDTVGNGVMTIIDDTGNYMDLRCAGAVTDDPVRCAKRVASGTPGFASYTGFTVNTWHHVAAVFISDTSRYVYVDGVQSSEDTVSVTDFSTSFVFYFGRDGSLSHLDGRMMWPAIYDVALSSSEVASLANGSSPLEVRGESLIIYDDHYEQRDSVTLGVAHDASNGTWVASEANPSGLMPAYYCS